MLEAGVTDRLQPLRSDSGADSDYTRLHITPFDAGLLSLVIPASILPNARNISYHTIETLPDKRYGFVDLPLADAERVRKRLNGTVLKGAKMRVDKAKAETWQAAEAESPVPDKKRKKQKAETSKDKGPKEKKRKKDYEVVPGIELEDGRKVKRGWTVTDEDKIKEKRKSKKERDEEKKEGKDKKKEKKREERSRYTDKEECLLKTKLPGGPAPADTEDSDRKKRKKAKSRETVIHEFANTTKFPTFLKANKASTTDSGMTEFVEGKGWVDAEGNVLEPVKPKRVKAEPPAKKAAPAPQPSDDTNSDSSSEDEESSNSRAANGKSATVTESVPADDDTTSSSGSSSDEDSDSGEGPAKPTNTAVATPAKSILKSTPAPPVDDDTTSSSGSSSEDSDSDSEVENPSTPVVIAPSSVDALKSDSRPKSSSSNVSLTIKIPAPPPLTPGEVHPLEALYKRRNAGAAAENEEAEPFSFFAGNDDEMEEDEPDAGASTQMPLTPFTQRDFDWRNVRSAAPTPDTAHPSRVKNFWAIGSEGADEDMVDDDEEVNNALAEGESAESGPVGDFQKWFWENRRDLNRSWMKRKKTAAKEKRHRENKSRAAKAV